MTILTAPTSCFGWQKLPRTRIRRLRRIGQSLKAAVPQLDQLDLIQDEIGHWHLQARYEHWRHTPARQTEQDFSDGTLRLIGLLWSLLEGKKDAGPVLLEEPELSLHTSVVRQLPTILSRVRSSGGPQVLLTTHANDVSTWHGFRRNFISLLRWIKLRVVWIIQRRSLFWRLLPEHHMRVYLSG